MKKVLSLLLVLCLCMAMFVACAEDKDPEATKAPEADPTAVATTAPTKGPTAEPTPTPTPKPTIDPALLDPEVDAVLHRFWDEYMNMWEAPNFMTSDDVGYAPIGDTCEYYYEEGNGLVIKILANDPYFYMPVTGELGEPWSFYDYPVMKVRIKNPTPVPIFEMFVCAEGADLGAAVVQYQISTGDTEFKDYIIDLAEVKGQNFVDAADGLNVQYLRLDALSVDAYLTQLQEEGEFYFYVDYIGFFKTVEDAENWNPAHVTNAKDPAPAE